MITIDQIHKKAELLDPLRLQELADFLDFLLQKNQAAKASNAAFPPTELEDPGVRTIYQGRTLSQEEMDQAVEHEAGLHR